MKLNRKEFRIGDVVMVRAVSIGITALGKRTIARKKFIPRMGMVTGVRRVFVGQVNPGSGNNQMSIFGPDDYDPPEFKPEASYEFWAVRFGLTNKEVLVAPGDLWKASDKNKVCWKFPLRYQEVPSWSGEGFDVPRDDCGRFTCVK